MPYRLVGFVPDIFNDGVLAFVLSKT